MVIQDLVAAKLSELSDRIERVRSKCPASAGILAKDADALEIVSFNLMLAVQVCVDVAAHITADERWVPAQSLAEGFTRLEQHAVLRPNTAESLRRAVGLRNLVAHGYARVDSALIFRAATAGLADLSDFAREIAGWLRARL